MKKLLLSILGLSSLGLMAQVGLIGTWTLSPKAYAIAVGPEKGNYSWWGNPADEVTGARACQFDDEFVFNQDGSFQNILGDETFIEGWQGSDGCGAPVAPHDGTATATWSFDNDARTITIVGKGAFIGIPKVYNGGELKNPADAKDTIVYEVSMIDANTLLFEISIGSGYWMFELSRKGDQASAIDPTGSWKFAPKGYAMAVGPARRDFSWWGNPADEVTGARACQFDDEFVFADDSAQSFKNVLGDETFIEGWQGSDGCGTPVAPHDGSSTGMWTVDYLTRSIVIHGTGNYLGIPKVYNGGELSDPANAPESISYYTTITDDTMLLDISVGSGWWTFELVKSSPMNASKAVEMNNIKLYPNPVDQVLFVNSNSTIQSVTVRDFAGKAIRTYTDAISSGINVSFLSAGSYLLEVNTTAGTEVSKFLKN